MSMRHTLHICHHRSHEPRDVHAGGESENQRAGTPVVPGGGLSTGPVSTLVTDLFLCQRHIAAVEDEDDAVEGDGGKLFDCLIV